MFTIDKTKCVECARCVYACPIGIFRRGEGGVEVGPEKRCMHCMHCAAACPTQAVGCEGISPQALYQTAPEDALERLVKSRRSVRHYGDGMPERETVARALADAAWAPSAKNSRTYGWLVLWGREQTDRAAALVTDWARETREAPELVALARAGRNMITCGAPCAILGHAPDATYPALDTAIATTTLELLLNHAGLATCWGGYLARGVNASPELRSWLGVPEGHRVHTALMTGYAHGEDYPHIPYRPSAPVRWLGQEDGAAT